MRLYDKKAFSNATPVAPPITTGERERPGVAHSSVHQDREAEHTRFDDVHMEFDVNRAFNPTSLKAPEPRHGMMQRWVADGTNPTAEKGDQLNWFGKRHKGWTPRDPESVPERQRRLYPSVKLHDGSTAIRIAGMVLCELPIRVAKAYGDVIRGRIQHQSKAIPDSLQELRKRERQGVGPLHIEDEHAAYRGRKAASYVD
jgi:hypothetical protein